MGSPSIPKTPDPPQPDAPAAKAIFNTEDSPTAAVKKKTQIRSYLSAPSTPTAAPGVQL